VAVRSRNSADGSGAALGRTKEFDMAYKITDECTACGSCKESCPAEAIKEGEKKYTIDPELCIDCGSCVDACQAKAIVEG
jgi:ferredoxin